MIQSEETSLHCSEAYELQSDAKRIEKPNVIDLNSGTKKAVSVLYVKNMAQFIQIKRKWYGVLA